MIFTSYPVGPKKVEDEQIASWLWSFGKKILHQCFCGSASIETGNHVSCIHKAVLSLYIKRVVSYFFPLRFYHGLLSTTIHHFPTFSSNQRYFSSWFCPFAHRSTIALEHHADCIEYKWDEALGWEQRPPTGDEDFTAAERDDWWYGRSLVCVPNCVALCV